MVCKKCGAETLDGAVFCGSCGTRLDGKKPCAACKQLNDENSAYCVFCGARIDGKRVCARCGTAYEGKFCPGCGYGGETAKSVNPTTAPLGETKGNGKKWTLKRILSFSASCLGMLGVLVALIFTFFIGVASEVGGEKATASESTLGAAQSLFYFFGDFFKDAKALNLSGDKTLAGTMTRFTVYTYGISGLVIAIATLALVVTFATIAVVRFVMGLMGLTQKSADKWSILTMCSFFFGTGAFYGIHKYIMEVSASSSGVSASTSMGIVLKGGATAGIIICSILLGLLVVCKLIAKGKALFTAKAIVKLALGVVGVAFSAVVFGCIKNSGVAHTVSGTGVDLDMGVDLSAGVEMKGGFTPFLLSYGVTFLAGLANVFLGTENVEIVFSEVENAVIFGNLAQIVLLVALLFAAFALCAKLTAVTEENSRSGMGWSIAVFALLVVALIFALISVNAMESVYEWSVSASEVDLELENLLEFKTTGLIVALVFSVLMLGLSIAQAVLNCMRKRREEVTQPYQY